MTDTTPAAPAAAPETARTSALFFDSTNLNNYPRGYPGCFYFDGDFAVTSEQVSEIVDPSERRWITVTGDGVNASIVDGVPDNYISPARMRAFVRTRRAMNTAAIVYSPRAYVAEWLSVLADFGHGSLAKYAGLYWWIPTLDGKQWTAAELAADLADNWDADIPADRIWGNQWNQLPSIGPAARVDVSTLFLPWRPGLESAPATAEDPAYAALGLPTPGAPT